MTCLEATTAEAADAISARATRALESHRAQVPGDTLITEGKSFAELVAVAALAAAEFDAAIDAEMAAEERTTFSYADRRAARATVPAPPELTVQSTEPYIVTAVFTYSDGTVRDSGRCDTPPVRILQFPADILAHVGGEEAAAAPLLAALEQWEEARDAAERAAWTPEERDRQEEYERAEEAQNEARDRYLEVLHSVLAYPTMDPAKLAEKVRLILQPTAWASDFSLDLQELSWEPVVAASYILRDVVRLAALYEPVGLESAALPEPTGSDAQFLAWEREHDALVKAVNTLAVQANPEDDEDFPEFDRACDLFNLICTTPCAGPVGAGVKLRVILADTKLACRDDPKPLKFSDVRGRHPKTGEIVSLPCEAVETAIAALPQAVAA